jgi:hypothetical protein
MRLTGSSPLVLTIERSGGADVASCTVAASAIAVGTPGLGSGDARWEGCSFSPVTLAAGTTYYLVASTASGTRYSIYPIREGSGHGYAANTYFAEGTAQYSSNGSSWSAYGSTQYDLQFYLR